MWTSLFAVTAVIAIALTMAAIVVDSVNGGKFRLVTASCLKRPTWGGLAGRPFLLCEGRYPAPGTLRY